MPNKIPFRGKIKELKGGRGDSLGLQGVMPACRRQACLSADRVVKLVTNLFSKD